MLHLYFYFFLIYDQSLKIKFCYSSFVIDVNMIIDTSLTNVFVYSSHVIHGIIIAEEW